MIAGTRSGGSCVIAVVSLRCAERISAMATVDHVDVGAAVAGAATQKS